jgi:hypothetical protein
MPYSWRRLLPGPAPRPLLLTPPPFLPPPPPDTLTLHTLTLHTLNTHSPLPPPPPQVPIHVAQLDMMDLAAVTAFPAQLPPEFAQVGAGPATPSVCCVLCVQCVQTTVC